ncbi:MAG: hypothetical protein KBF53_10860 [Sphingobium sp.]|jgi:hypothetical protein|nr:hypothetical protein [Sphingobium sp.]
MQKVDSLPRLESGNFRIPTNGWKEKKLAGEGWVLLHPQGDVSEHLDGPNAGEQHFTWKAAVRETRLCGKLIPTLDEWMAILRTASPHLEVSEDWQKVANLHERFGLPLAGSMHSSGAVKFEDGKSGHYWGLSRLGVFGLPVSFSETEVRTACNAVPTHRFSIRCLAA